MIYRVCHEDKSLDALPNNRHDAHTIRQSWHCRPPGGQRPPASGSLPYGYDKIGKKRDTQLVIVENEAEIVLNIFKWYTHENMNRREIARRLTQRGIQAPSGSAARNAGTIHRMLRQETYTGTFYACRSRRVKDKKHSRSSTNKTKRSTNRLQQSRDRLRSNSTNLHKC